MVHKSLIPSSTRYCTSLLRLSRSSQCWRPFTTSRRLPAIDERQQPPSQPSQPTSPSRATSTLTPTPAKPTTNQNATFKILDTVGTTLSNNTPSTLSTYGIGGFTNLADKYGSTPTRYGDDEYHLSVYSHKRNTHLTLADPQRNSIFSYSTGNLGFRKSQRGTYDAAYQLMAYLLTRIQQQGLMAKITKLELALRGFGQGRDAVVKVLLGTEGTRLRDTIVRVVDKTKLKFGGPRSRKPRRLG